MNAGTEVPAFIFRLKVLPRRGSVGGKSQNGLFHGRGEMVNRVAHKLFTVRVFVSALILASMGMMLSANAQLLGPQEPPFMPTYPIVIQNGYLIDATGAAPKLGYTVVIQGDQIVEVAPYEDVEVPEGAQVINAKGMTIMPGIINSNQHVQLNPLYPAGIADLPLDVLKSRWEESFARMPQRAYVYLMQGVTSMRHTSGPAARLLPLKRQIDAGELPGPRLFLGGALFMSPQHFAHYIRRSKTPPESIEWLKDEFAYNVVEDLERDTDKYLGPEFSFWKLYMSDEIYDGENDFSDQQLEYIIEKAHKHGKKIDLHAGAHNAGLKRMLEFDIDTLEHPFYGHSLIDQEVIDGYVNNDVIIASLLRVMVTGAEFAEDPHRLNESLYITSMEPKDYRLLMRYRDKMLLNKERPDDASLPIYATENSVEHEKADATFTLRGHSYTQQQRRRQTSHENMRRFIRAGATFSLGTDTPSFLNFQQEDPNAREFGYMVAAGITPMDAIIAATRNGAEALGVEDRLGTIEEGKLADVIVVAGNPLADPNALKRVYAVIKGGVRYK